VDRDNSDFTSASPTASPTDSPAASPTTTAPEEVEGRSVTFVGDGYCRGQNANEVFSFCYRYDPAMIEEECKNIASNIPEARGFQKGSLSCSIMVPQGGATAERCPNGFGAVPVNGASVPFPATVAPAPTGTKCYSFQDAKPTTFVGAGTCLGINNAMHGFCHKTSDDFSLLTDLDCKNDAMAAPYAVGYQYGQGLRAVCRILLPVGYSTLDICPPGYSQWWQNDVMTGVGFPTSVLPGDSSCYSFEQ